jgi:hypothetical protein
MRESIGGNGIDFVYELFDSSHTIQESYNHEGYIILYPKI